MPSASTGRTLWPLHRKPLPDELLSSWLVRLATAQALKVHSFCVANWPRRAIWSRDIDKSADAEIVDVLAERTATPRPRVEATCLAAYEGVLYESHNPVGNTRWILPVGIYHRTRRARGLQYCPACLEEDPVPYFRRAWRLACFTVCVRHDLPLRDGCPGCGAPIQFFRGDMAHRSKAFADPVTKCHTCGVDLRSAGACPGRIETDHLFRQHIIARQIREGWAWVPGHGPVHAHLYFDVLRQLVRLLAMDKHGRRLRAAASQRYGLEPIELEYPKGHNAFEYMTGEDRGRLISIALLLLADWPNGFVELCAEHRIWSSTLLRDMESPPFWYWSVVQETLVRKSPIPSDADRSWGKRYGKGVFGNQYRGPKRDRRPARRYDWPSIFALLSEMPESSSRADKHRRVRAAIASGELAGGLPDYSTFCDRLRLNGAPPGERWYDWNAISMILERLPHGSSSRQKHRVLLEAAERSELPGGAPAYATLCRRLQRADAPRQSRGEINSGTRRTPEATSK